MVDQHSQATPATDDFVEILGNRIHYLDRGSGPVLLFVHAGPAWSFIFRNLIDRLRDGFRCIALDFPGSGLSRQAPGYRIGIESAAAVLEAFIQQLDLRDITLVVHDLGGPVSWRAVTSMSERFRGVAVIDSFSWSIADTASIARPLRLVSGRTFGVLDRRLNLLGHSVSSSYGCGRNWTRTDKRAFLAPYREGVVRRNAAAMLGDAVRADEYIRRMDGALRRPLGRLPLLLVFGDHSPTYKARFPAAWMDRYPHAQLFVIKNGHHFPMGDCPDLVVGAIRAWREGWTR